jgi:hypothetical protein
MTKRKNPLEIATPSNWITSQRGSGWHLALATSIFRAEGRSVPPVPERRFYVDLRSVPTPPKYAQPLI